MLGSKVKPTPVLSLEHLPKKENNDLPTKCDFE
jgi:hypothetical protein